MVEWYRKRERERSATADDRLHHVRGSILFIYQHGNTTVTDLRGTAGEWGRPLLFTADGVTSKVGRSSPPRHQTLVSI